MNPTPWTYGSNYDQCEPGVYIADANGAIVVADTTEGTFTIEAAKRICDAVNARPEAEPQGAPPAAEGQRRLAARLGETMCADIVVTEAKGAPETEVYWAGAPYQRENREAHEKVMAHLQGLAKGAPQKPEGET